VVIGAFQCGLGVEANTSQDTIDDRWHHKPARNLVRGRGTADAREIRYLDKLIDELAKGKAMEKILRAG